MTYSQQILSKNEEHVPWGVFDVIFSYILIFALSIIFAGSMLLAGLDENMNFFLVMLQITLSLSTLAIVYLIVTKKYKIPFSEAFGLSYSRIHSSLNIGIFITAIIILTTTLISLLFSGLTGADSGNPYSGFTEERLRWLSILSIFFAPIVEEIFFRGFMQPAISKLLGSFFGIILTAIIFGVSHTQYLEYNAAIFSVTAIGLILGVARYKTGSVMPGIFAHFFNNLLAIIYLLK